MPDGSNRPTVLVANPDDQVREILARLIEEAGFEAVRLDPTVDVPDAVVATTASGLVLDLGADNLPVLEALRRRPEATAGSVRVVVVGTGPASGRLAIAAGADGFLVRPFHGKELQGALSEAVGRSESKRHAWRASATAALNS